MSALPAFPKPSQREGKITLTPRQRRIKLYRFCEAQGMKCCYCGCSMTIEPYMMNTATLSHRNPEPMGAKKRDNDDNLDGAACFRCNNDRGSKRG